MEATSPAAGVDRISQLPVEIIHIILQSLDSHKSAARTSILSRTWLHLWTTYPYVEFMDLCGPHVSFEFDSFASATSKRLRLAGPPLDTFTVTMGCAGEATMGRGKERRDLYGYNFYSSLYELLSSGRSRSPIRVSVKNYLHIRNDFSPRLDMFLNCDRTKFLELTGCDISRSELNSGLKNLEELRLDSVEVRECSFSSFLANAPRLETLKLKWIRGIHHSLDISAAKFPSLKSLSFDESEHDEFKLELSSAPLLENFSFTGSFKFLNVVSAPNVKSLELHPENDLKYGEIEELISKFPSLESLDLWAGGLSSFNRKIRISTHTLRELTVRYLSSGTEIEIDAPNLEILTIEVLELDFKCNAVNVVSVAPSCRLVFGCLRPGMRTGTSWLIELRKVVKAFAARFHHLVFKFEFGFIPLFRVGYLDLTLAGMESSPITVGHLLIGIDRSDIEIDFFNVVLSAFHPKKLSIAESSGSIGLFSVEKLDLGQVEMESIQFIRVMLRSPPIPALTSSSSSRSSSSDDVLEILSGNRHWTERIPIVKQMEEIISPDAGVDRISQLPAKIIHLILHSLDSHKSAARTSILSRTWLHLWTTYPYVEFKDIGGRSVNFESFASATSKRLRLAGPPLLLDTFTVTLGRWEDHMVGRVKEWRESYGETFIPSLYELLSSGSSRSPIRVSVENYLSSRDDFSPCLDMFLNCGRTKFLELTGCDISSRSQFNSGMENLEELTLRTVKVMEHSFSSFLANAPRLEKLTLRGIRGIRHSLDISAAEFPSLKSLCVGEPNGFKVELSSAPLLENFSFSGSLNFLNVVSAPNVKSVDLQPDYDLMHGEIEELISRFPSLESLGLSAGRLTSYGNNRKIRISTHTLRELTVRYLSSGTEIEIDAPNLEILTIETTKLDIKCNVVNVVSVAPSCRVVFVCSSFDPRIGTSWLIELRKCLKAFAVRFHHLVFKLELGLCPVKVENLNLTLAGMASSPITVGHLLMGIDRSNTEIDYFDIVLSAFHPKKLSIAESPSNRRLFSVSSLPFHSLLLSLLINVIFN
ncbi:hypothetical protein LINGRAHAP2_LOCUS18341 [Linum grandiflorum]